MILMKIPERMTSWNRQTQLHISVATRVHMNWTGVHQYTRMSGISPDLLPLLPDEAKPLFYVIFYV